MAKRTINDIIHVHNKSISGVDKHLSSHASIVLDATSYTPAELKAAIEADSAVFRAAEEARLRYLRLAAESRATKKVANARQLALRSYVTLHFGGAAVDVIGDFGFAPKAAPTRSAATLMQAIAKAKATRVARHTMGKRQRLAIKAPVVVPGDAE